MISSGNSHPDKLVTLFLCGDVMTGRGIDQILSHPGDPRLYERFVKDARHYAALAEQASGPIPRPASYRYIWGDALPVLDDIAPDLRIINLETAITSSDDYWPDKAVHYRMHPANVTCLAAANIDCCALANNHVLDWGYPGLIQTLQSLDRIGVNHAGAGGNLGEAAAPAVMRIKGRGRVLFFSFGLLSSGIPPDWAATEDKPGVNLLYTLSDEVVQAIAAEVRAVKESDDVVIASIHWGGNWGYEIPKSQRRFAHQLIDVAGVDLIHGHSSHHVKGIEVYKGRLILYGCGDFLTDYEGIKGYEEFRDDLGLMYFPSLDLATGELFALRMLPTRLRKLRLNRASEAEALWLRDVLIREGRALGTNVTMAKDGALLLLWD